MNSKGHLYTSLIKSAIRVVGCVLALQHNSIFFLATSLVLAEGFGIFEELLDTRD